MANVVREDIDALNATLSVQLKKEEIQPLFELELKKQRNKAHLKGFRKGKTPRSTLLRMFGHAVLSEVIDQEVNKAMTDYMVKEKVSFLGNPIPSEKHKQQEVDPRNLQDLEFSFDLGLVPQFELQEPNKKAKLIQYEVEVDKKRIDEEMEKILRQLGTQEPVDDKIGMEDILRCKAEQMDGKKVVEKGFHTHFSVSVDRLTDAALKKVKGKKAGHNFAFDIYELEKDTTPEFVNQHLLSVAEEEAAELGKTYQITVEQVLRVIPAEPTAENLEKVFGPDQASNEEEARELIEKAIKRNYDQQADLVLFKLVQKSLLETHKDELPLPDEFLKRWLRSRNEESELSAEDLEKDYPLFAEDLRWRLLKEKMMEKFELQITEEDIRQGFRNQIMSYFGGSMGNEDLIEQMVDRSMESQEQIERVQQEVITDKLYERLKEELPIEQKSIKPEKFEEIQKEHLPNQR